MAITEATNFTVPRKCYQILAYGAPVSDVMFEVIAKRTQRKNPKFLVSKQEKFRHEITHHSLLSFSAQLRNNGENVLPIHPCYKSRTGKKYDANAGGTILSRTP